jgi:hypothetical protein
MLEQVIEAIADVLRGIGGSAGYDAVIQVEDAPPKRLPGLRTFLMFELPGTSVPSEHTGRHGGIVYQRTDTVFVEYHRKLQQDEGAEAAREIRPLHDRTIDALWSAFQRTRFDNTVLGVTSIDTDGYGPDLYDKDVTFGFRIAIVLTHRSETLSGKVPS